MKYKIEFQYKPEGKARPYEEVQSRELKFENGEYFPIPAVGDTVEYEEDDQEVERKVLTRHYSYLGQWCVVVIVVTDVSDEEMTGRLKM